MATITPNPYEAVYVVYSQEFRQYISCHGTDIHYVSEMRNDWELPQILVFSDKYKEVFSRKLNRVIGSLVEEVCRWCSNIHHNNGNFISNNSILRNQVERFLRVNGIYDNWVKLYGTSSWAFYPADWGLVCPTLKKDLICYKWEYSPNGIVQKTIDICSIGRKKINKYFR